MATMLGGLTLTELRACMLLAEMEVCACFECFLGSYIYIYIYLSLVLHLF